MYLHEEYIKRHNLEIPVILYKQRSTVFLKSKNLPYRWRILAFSWHEPDRHPGFWEVTYNSVVHNGYKANLLISELVKIEMCHSDEYEKSVWRMVNLIKGDGFLAIESQEQVLASWQIFLMIYDSWLASNMNMDFFGLVADSLNQELPIKERIVAFKIAQRKLCIDRSVYDVWNHTLSQLVNDGSEWLIRLIND